MKHNLPVDVTVCTYNSEKFLKSCLASIKRNIPVKTLWIVDNYSSDGTLKIAESFCANVVESKGSLAESRQISFSLVETPLFVNVDSDIMLSENWFSNISRFLTAKHGAVWGVCLTMYPIQHRHYQEAMYSFKNPSRYNLIFLGDMLARKEAVEGLSFPSDYNHGAVAGEDYYIKSFIEKKGFKTLTAPNIFVEHYCNPPPLGLKTYWAGASTRLSERRGLFSVLARTLLSGPQGMFAAVRSHDALVLPYWVRYRSEQVYGWLHWNKYYNFRRPA